MNSFRLSKEDSVALKARYFKPLIKSDKMLLARITIQITKNSNARSFESFSLVLALNPQLLYATKLFKPEGG